MGDSGKPPTHPTSGTRQQRRASHPLRANVTTRKRAPRERDRRASWECKTVSLPPGPRESWAQQHGRHQCHSRDTHQVGVPDCRQRLEWGMSQKACAHPSSGLGWSRKANSLSGSLCLGCVSVSGGQGGKGRLETTL